jgi:hypothetical protein
VTLRRIARVSAVAAWLLAVAPMTATYGAGSSGSTLDAAGWWSKSQAMPVQGDVGGLGAVTAPTVPPPATVPPKGLYVSGDGTADGSAIAAVRFRLDGQAGGTLTLRLPSGSTLTGTESVVACPIVGGFTPAENGRWDSKPGYEPASCIIEGTPADDGTSMSFAIPATFASALGDVSVAVVPAAGATPFSLAFDPPADDSFTVTTQVQSSPTSSDAPAYEPGSAVFTAPSTSSSPTFDAPETALAQPPASDGSHETAAVAPVAPVALAGPALTGSGRTVQVVAIALLMAIGGGLWWLGSRPQRAPRLLGSVGGGATAEALVTGTVRPSRPRGIGRFARHRDAPPTAI